MAFVDRFNFTNYGLYDIKVLNSGVNLPGVEIEFTPEAFSFLKLHGSVAGWTVDISGMGHPLHQRCIFATPDPREAITVNDDYFFLRPQMVHIPTTSKGHLSYTFRMKGSLSFPMRADFYFIDMPARFGNEAKELISNATEIRVIGYSFSGIDRGEMLNMLSQASSCQRLVIQGPDADQICQRLKVERPQLGNLIQSAPYPF